MHLHPSRPRRLAPLGLAAVLFAAAAAAVAVARPGQKSARAFAWETLERHLTGSFSTEDQSRGDPDYLELRADLIPIMKGRADGRWLYVERAVPGLRGAPYRQAVYRLGGAEDLFDSKDERRFELSAFVLADPSRFAGASIDPGRIDSIAPGDLVPRPGCSVVLKQGGDGTFQGGTVGRACEGDSPGVSYVTSEWFVDKDLMKVWDRAYDAEGRQLWGATKGPYVFRRLGEP